KKISFKDINFHNVSNQSKQNKIISNIDLNDTSTGSSDLVKTDYISSDLADMLFEVDNININLNYFESDQTSYILNDHDD
ncbi:10117_t:CDS:1, partial [Cetraspora pellucida]